MATKNEPATEERRTKHDTPQRPDQRWAKAAAATNEAKRTATTAPEKEWLEVRTVHPEQDRSAEPTTTRKEKATGINPLPSHERGIKRKIRYLNYITVR